MSSKKQKTSEIWNFFTPIKGEKYYALCNMCKKKLSYRTTNSNLKKHITSNHPTISMTSLQVRNHSKLIIKNTQATKDEDTTRLASTSTDTAITSSALPSSLQSATQSEEKCITFLPRKIEKPTINDINEKLLQLFITDFQNFRIVEDKGFKEFVHALNPLYDLPNRKKISQTLIPAWYNECVTNCRQLVNKVNKICLTTDCWTSVNTESFIALTGHFINDSYELKTILLECSLMKGRDTSQNLALTINRIAEDWGLAEKIILVVTDNATNMKNAVTKDLGWKHFGCFAHTLNLIVADSLSDPDIAELTSKIRTIVGHFKRSSLATQRFIDYQKRTNAEPLKLIHDVASRWNTTFYMLERFTNLENAIKSTIAILDNANIPVLTPNEWKISRELCIVLRPFEVTTKTISGENYTIGSFVIPLVNGLNVVCKNLLKKKFVDIVNRIVTKMNEELLTRLGHVENNNILATAAFLDPRFKLMAFQNRSIAENTKEHVISLVAAKIELEQKQATSEQMCVDVNQVEDEENEFSIWGTLQGTISRKPHQQNSATNSAIIEVQRYLEVDFLPRHCDPLKFWREESINFPNLSVVVQENFCVLATSVPCERLFSKAGLAITDRRNKLSAKKAENLLFLNTNHYFCKK